jgi:mono/diheme cytochrome c family protein/rhodanese-related sulfurtransferase
LAICHSLGVLRQLIVTGAIAAVAACNPGAAQPPPATRAAPPAAARDAGTDADLRGLPGQKLYVALCAPCHAVDGHGYAADHAPSLISQTFLESASDDFLRRAISAGRPGTSMAAYSAGYGGPLDAAGINGLVAYLRSLGPAAKNLTAVGAGDAQAGQAIYAQRCLTCHGDRKTRGEGTSLGNAQFLLAATDSFIRYAVVNGRPGTKMVGFTGQLTDAEIDNVVAYVRSLGKDDPDIKPLPAPTGNEPIVLNAKGKSPRFTLRADPCPGGVPCKQDPRYVHVADVAAALAAKQKIVIIDARPPSEWMRVHIPGAVSIPYHDMKRLDEVPKDGTWIVAYCACPHHLSGIVVDELRKRGYTNTAVLDEGINDWHRRGFPVVAAEGVTKPPAEPAPAPAGTLH